MSEQSTVYVGGEKCTLVSINELCTAYGKQSKPDWLSDEIPSAKKYKVNIPAATGGTTLPQQGDSDTDEKKDVSTTDESDKSGDEESGEAEPNADKTVCNWKNPHCSFHVFVSQMAERYGTSDSDTSEHLSAVEKVALDAECDNALKCTETFMCDLPTSFVFKFDDSVHMKNTDKIMKAFDVECHVTSMIYAVNWNETVPGATYPLDDMRFFEYRKFWLYSRYPCKKNLVGSGDLYDQCQQGMRIVTTDEEGDKDSDVNVWDTLSSFWDKYGPIKCKDLFRNAKVPQRERIKWSSMKAVDKIQWDNLLDVWMVDVFRPMSYLNVFDKYGKKETDVTVQMHYALIESMLSVNLSPVEISEFKKNVKKWMLGCSKKNTLYISGVPDAGKSMLAEMFCKVFVYYKKNAASKNFPLDSLSDNKLIWLEEFTSHLLTTGNITFFKQIFGGQSIRRQ
eukprot:Em0022g824a